jgi:hypothetical protein
MVRLDAQGNDCSDHNPSRDEEHMEILTRNLRIHHSEESTTAILTTPRRRQILPRPVSLSPPPYSTSSTTISPRTNSITSSLLSEEGIHVFFISMLAMLRYMVEGNIMRLDTRIKQFVAINVYPRSEHLQGWIHSNDPTTTMVRVLQTISFSQEILIREQNLTQLTRSLKLLIKYLKTHSHTLVTYHVTLPGLFVLRSKCEEYYKYIIDRT